MSAPGRPAAADVYKRQPYDRVGASAGYSWQAGRMEVPVYEGLPYPLWGLTARITWWLLERYGDILTGML